MTEEPQNVERSGEGGYYGVPTSLVIERIGELMAKTYRPDGPFDDEYIKDVVSLARSAATLAIHNRWKIDHYMQKDK